MQRCKLFETILALSNPAKQWMYADTDSLFLHDLNEKDEEYISSLISEELGDWDYENKKKQNTAEIAILGAKRYEINSDDFHKQKLSGVKKAVSFRHFLHDKVVSKACLRPLYCKSGIALIEVDKEISWGFQ